MKSLTVGQVLFEEPVCIQLEAADEKNRKGTYLPVRSDLANELRSYLAERLEIEQRITAKSNNPLPVALPPCSPLLPVPRHLVRHLNADLKAAEIPKVDDRGFVIDIHALRHTFASLLARAGTPQRITQELMRHSDPRLTSNVYTHLRIQDTAVALDVLPSVPLAARTPVGACGQVADNKAPRIKPPQRLPRLQALRVIFVHLLA
jgi:integrase